MGTSLKSENDYLFTLIVKSTITLGFILVLGTLAIYITTLNKPVDTIVIYKVDNQVELHGKVTGKSIVGKLYTLDCGSYGKFLVSKEQYDSVQVGDDIPSYLRSY